MPHLLFNFEPYHRHYIARLRHRQHLSVRSSQITIHPHRSCHPRRLPRYPTQTSISGPISVALLAFHFISSSLRAQLVGSLHQPCDLSTSSVMHTWFFSQFSIDCCQNAQQTPSWIWLGHTPIRHSIRPFNHNKSTHLNGLDTALYKTIPFCIIHFRIFRKLY